MQIPETPLKIEQLDLMKRLEAYAEGKATWFTDGSPIGDQLKSECRNLHSGLVQLVSKVLEPVLSRTTARETEMFTIHDATHGRKVAHLMWHILEPKRREQLTPPEIGMLIASAFMHDLGMALTLEEREARLAPNSDLWVKLEIQESQKNRIEKLRRQISDPDSTRGVKERAERLLFQAEEAILCQDTRERHATHERYEEIVKMMREFHQKDSSNIPDIESILSFDGFSFLDKVIDICESHAADAEILVQDDGTGTGRPRFPSDYPVGRCTADTHLVAASLRLADILEFDRERTPPVLYYYLLPVTLGPEHESVLEWGKHLAICNWNIEKEAIVFRGRCKDHIIHHSVVQFCNLIENEISTTKTTFGPLQELRDPFFIPSSVNADIHEEGYHYIPYRFELDDERVYQLMMGGAIYDNPLVAVRELIQNAVDACKLRDALMHLHEPHVQLSNKDRIFVRYEEPNESHSNPVLTVTDTGTGMDAITIERWFLKVGRSYYTSSEFNQTRFQLAKAGLDFAPVSEFGIGFLSCFLLTDLVKVETAMWESVHKGDISKRTLYIEGPTRLIRLEEDRNDGPGRFKGTKVTLYLIRGNPDSKETMHPSWEQVKDYLSEICLDLPYHLNLEHVAQDGQVTREFIRPVPLSIELPLQLEPFSYRIKVDDKESGLEGEIIIPNVYLEREHEKEIYVDYPLTISKPKGYPLLSDLIRGGFKIGDVPGIPRLLYTRISPVAMLRLSWESESNLRYPMPNLSRSGTTDFSIIGNHVLRIWLYHLLEKRSDLPEGLICKLEFNIRKYNLDWLEMYDALTLYDFAKQGWLFFLRDSGIDLKEIENWEMGKGNSLPFPRKTDYLYIAILNLILPKVVSLRMDHWADFYVNPPVENWCDIFKNWHNYMKSPISWGPFVEYINGIKSVLYYEYPYSVQLNLRFKDTISSFFNEDEFIPLVQLFGKLVSSRSASSQASLIESEISLLNRAINSIGNLEIGGIKGTWSIDSFKPSDISNV